MRLSLRSVLVAVVALGLASCSDSPSAPANSTVTSWPAPGESLNSAQPLLSNALTRRKALAADVVFTARVDSAGGTFKVPGAGLVVMVPAGAVAAPMTITATAVAGRAVAFEFEPHGTTFAKPLRLTLDLHGTNWGGLPLVDFRAVYFAERSQIDPVQAVIGVNEVLPVAIDTLRQEVTFDVYHFSGYGVSTGRRGPNN